MTSEHDHAPPAAPAAGTTKRRGTRLWWMLLPVLCVAVGVGASRVAAMYSERGYSQATPDDVIRTAQLMVDRGDAGRLTRLVYAENQDMRRLLNTLGLLLQNLQVLGSELSQRFPREVAQLTKSAEESAKSGKAGGLIAQLMSSQRPQRSRNRDAARKEQQDHEDAMRSAISRIFADPYGALKEGAGKLSTVPVNDDMVAILYEGQPVLPPLGLAMRRGADGKWAVVLPTNIPMLASYMPQTSQEYQVFGSMIAVLNNVVVDLTADVRTGKVKSLDEVARIAGEKAFVPGAMVFVAYQSMVDKRLKAAREKKPASESSQAPATAPAATKPGG